MSLGDTNVEVEMTEKLYDELSEQAKREDLTPGEFAEKAVTNALVSRRIEKDEKTLAIPVNPLGIAVLRGCYSRDSDWNADPSTTRRYYDYERKDGHITLELHSPARPIAGVAAITDAVKSLSVETADVFLILLARIASLPDPRGIVRMNIEEIAGLLGVRRRHGSIEELSKNLHEHLSALARIQLTMIWKDY